MQTAAKRLPGLSAQLAPEAIEELAVAGLTRLHGYVTGIAVTPKRLPQDLWIGQLLESDENPLDAEDKAKVKTMVLVMLDQVLEGLNARTPHFEPPFKPGQVADARKWADGFMDAMAVCDEAWDQLETQQDVSVKTVPIRLLVTDDEEAKVNIAQATGKPFEQLESSAAATIRDSVLALNRHAKKVRGPLRAHANVPGRNDPCICGSGKKYKKCCGR